MGREVRKVPKDWSHPKNEDDIFIPLFENCGRFEEADREWSEGWEKWQEGLCENYSGDEKWSPIEDEHKNMRYSDYAGSRPSPDDYMPNWPDEQRTHFMMYEDTSEGTPISPAFETPEELARWLADNKASSFGSSTATYEQWLPICKGGWAPSMVLSSAGLQSGVESMSDL